MHWSGLWCPCCGYRLRGNPRNITYKDKLKETEFRSGVKVRIYKDWKNCKEFEYQAVLVEMIKPVSEGIGVMWTIRKYNEYKKNPECPTEERIINITNKDKVLV
jgi:hypothetical protein